MNTLHTRSPSPIARVAEALRDESLEALRQRNEARAAAMREQLGDRWLLHPDNRVRPIPQERGNVLPLVRARMDQHKALS